MADVILTANEMKQVERRAFDDGIDAEILMDHAGEGIAKAILEREPQPGLCIAYLGKGNNAGDAIVAGSLLSQGGLGGLDSSAGAGERSSTASEKEAARTWIRALSRTGFRLYPPVSPSLSSTVSLELVPGRSSMRL